MRRYVLVAGTVFAIQSLVQLARTLIGIPIVVYGVDIPRWPSALAFLITGTLAIWALRVSGSPEAPRDG